MAKLINLNLTSLLVIFFSLMSTLYQVEPSLMPNNPTKTMSYIRASCMNTLYPDLCYQCLSKYAHNSPMQNPQELVQTALSVSLTRAQDTRDYFIKVASQLSTTKNIINVNVNREYLSVQDCLGQLNDSVDLFGQSMKELHKINLPSMNSITNDQVMWHISNIETWVSTALTDASTCADSFSGFKGKLEASTRVRAQEVARVTSNALALFHVYAAKYRVAATAKLIKKP